jgi:hypothetical protein
LKTIATPRECAGAISSRNRVFACHQLDDQADHCGIRICFVAVGISGYHALMQTILYITGGIRGVGWVVISKGALP